MLFPKIRLAGARMLFCIPFIGCLNTDFGRVRPSLRSDEMHSWMGPAVAERYGEAESLFRLTDDERMMRDLAYPLIEPPYERQRWYGVLNEYGSSGFFQPDWWTYDESAYAAALLDSPTRSTETLYARLIDDIRNDIVRIGPFTTVARRVSDMDMRRDKSLRYVSNLTPKEHGNAVARIGENSLIARWVHQSLMERSYAYHYALERLVISSPSRQAAEAERQLKLMQMAIADAALVPRGQPGPWVTK
jgi:hypothetical protein